METTKSSIEDTFPQSDTVKGIERPPRRKIADPFVTGLIVQKVLDRMIAELPLPKTVSEEGMS